MYDYYKQSYRMIEENGEEYLDNPRKVIHKFIRFNIASLFRLNRNENHNLVYATSSPRIDYNKIRKIVQETNDVNYMRLIANISDRNALLPEHCTRIEQIIKGQLELQRSEHDEKTVPIVFITDNGYAIPTAVAISSLMFNADNPYQYDVYVVGEALSADMKKLIADSGFNVTIIESCISFDNVDFQHTHVTKAALNKFYIAELLPNIDKILYLDSDMLFLKNIKELYDEPLDGNLVGAVPDYHILSSNYMGVLSTVGIANYFNSGMLLLDLEKMRNENMSEGLLNMKIDLSKDDKFTFMDQDALNIFFYGNIRYLPVKYNFLNAYYSERSEYELHIISQEPIEQVIDAYDKPYVLHIGGGNKPWNSLLGEKLSLYQYYREVNRAYRKMGGKDRG